MHYYAHDSIRSNWLLGIVVAINHNFSYVVLEETEALTKRQSALQSVYLVAEENEMEEDNSSGGEANAGAEDNSGDGEANAGAAAAAALVGIRCYMHYYAHDSIRSNWLLGIVVAALQLQ